MASRYQDLLDFISENPECSKREVAAAMGMTRNNVSVTLHKVGTRFPLVRRDAIARMKEELNRLKQNTE